VNLTGRVRLQQVTGRPRGVQEPDWLGTHSSHPPREALWVKSQAQLEVVVVAGGGQDVVRSRQPTRADPGEQAEVCRRFVKTDPQAISEN
jgi:hypothetical protein